MKKQKVIKRKNLPSSFGLSSLLVYIMAADYYSLPEWMIGIVYFSCAIIFIANLISIFSSDYVDLFEDKEDRPKMKKSNFHERMDALTRDNNDN